MRSVCRTALASLLLSLLTGCASHQTAPRPPAGSTTAIERINLICRPVALNFDTVPGADGIGVTLYASNSKDPKTVPITEGSLEVLLFDGVLKAGDLATAEPLCVWTYTAQELRQLKFTGSIGVCYPLALRWGAKKPAQNRMTVFARYTPPARPTIQSQPAVISMLAQ